LQGNLVKYNTIDNKLRVSIECGEESANKVMPRFNDGIDKFGVMFSLTEDNIKRLFVPMINNSPNPRNLIATELIISQYTWLVAYKNDNLDYYNNDAKITEENIDSLSFYIVSSSDFYIRALENICIGKGAENNINDPFCESGVSNMQYNVLIFNPMASVSDEFSSPVIRTSPKLTFYQGVDGGKFEGVYYITNSIDSARQYSGSQSPYFSGFYAISMNYSMLISLIEHIGNTGTELPAVTSKFAIDNSNPPYTWDIEDSATGMIDDENNLTLDNVGVNLVQSIDDITNELVKFFQNI
jgi:hypothetical protein